MCVCVRARAYLLSLCELEQGDHSLNMPDPLWALLPAIVRLMGETPHAEHSHLHSHSLARSLGLALAK